MKKVLILMGRYLPGNRDGGPVRTIKNLTDTFGRELDFRIMCNDRDHGDTQGYPNIKVNSYNKVENASVYYVENGRFTFEKIYNEIKKVDIVYCCGPYNGYTIRTVFLKKMGLIKQPVYVASMGSFSKGALSIKSRKKLIFLNLMKIFGCFDKITWSVTSHFEKQDVKRIFGNDTKCIVAEDLPRVQLMRHTQIKEPNKLKVVFMSRISKIKNLEGAIDILSQISEFSIFFDIYGYMEDMEYWNQCLKKLNKLPKKIQWRYCGECKSEDVLKVFSQYDILLFPTKGENFGHVISEALLAGCIPVISDKTPWIELNKFNCGKVIPLNDVKQFVNDIYQFIKMDNEEFQKYIDAAYCYIQEKNRKSINDSGYNFIFFSEDMRI